MRPARDLGGEAEPASELAAVMRQLWLAQIEAEIAALLARPSLGDADRQRYRQLRERADELRGRGGAKAA